MLMPAMRAMYWNLPLPLLVPWVRADHEDRPVSADDLALLAHRLHRRSYLHDPFRLAVPARPALAAARGCRYRSRTCAYGCVGAQVEHDSRGLPGRRGPENGLRIGLRGSAGAVLEVPRREDPRAVRGDGDRELEVRGERAVLGVDRPAVVAHPHHVAPGGDHGLDREHHPLLQHRALAGR